jgi:hypothetical protein
MASIAVRSAADRALVAAPAPVEIGVAHDGQQPGFHLAAQGVQGA